MTIARASGRRKGLTSAERSVGVSVPESGYGRRLGGFQPCCRSNRLGALERAPLRHPETHRSVARARVPLFGGPPTGAGIDSYDKLIDRTPKDKVRRVIVPLESAAFARSG